ncbi:MAG: protein-glutamate methylesterase/protein-glutamine glutaminase [Ilumatobacteraceae bacterium]
MTDARVRVMVVDDSVVIRRLVVDILGAEPDFEVVGVATDGRDALERVGALRPDLITLDVEMPNLDGLGTLRALRAAGIRTPVIMFSTLTERGAAATMDALLAGANDYVTKPANVGSVQAAMGKVRDELVPKVRALARPAVVRPAPTAPTPTPARVERRPAATASPGRRIDAVVIGVSTGGPNALADLLPALPADLPVPVYVVQHMPPTFTRFLAERLDRHCTLQVREASGGERPVAGEVWIAPGGHHLVVGSDRSGPVLRISDAPPEQSCRPAADVLFRSVLTVYGGACLAVVMTGMGQDGLAGATAIHDAGGRVIAQDEATSIVWGMPGAVVHHGIADAVVPLAGLAGEIERAARNPMRKVLV